MLLPMEQYIPQSFQRYERRAGMLSRIFNRIRGVRIDNDTRRAWSENFAFNASNDQYLAQFQPGQQRIDATNELFLNNFDSNFMNRHYPTMFNHINFVRDNPTLAQIYSPLYDRRPIAHSQLDELSMRANLARSLDRSQLTQFKNYMSPNAFATNMINNAQLLGDANYMLASPTVLAQSGYINAYRPNLYAYGHMGFNDALHSFRFEQQINAPNYPYGLPRLHMMGAYPQIYQIY